MATNYDIDYNDERFKEVEADQKDAISDLEKTYSGMIDQTDGFYQKQIDAAKEWEKKQTEIQNQQTDFAIEKIEQQKDQAKKDYTKEQSGAYQDWKKQSNPYGVRAEQIADQGLQQSGYSESSQVSMYNTYQNRVATAREVYNRAVLNYDNAIKDARLQNNAALAEIAYKALQQQLELSLEGFQYKNTLILDKANKKLEVEQMYHERWQDVLNQMNTENALAEDIRQFNEQMAEEKRQFDFVNKIGEFAAPSGGSSGYSGWDGGHWGPSSSDKGDEQPTIKKSSGSASDAIAHNREVSMSAKESQLDRAIAAGASKDNVSNAISLALRNGQISQSEANSLRQTYTPRGLTY